MALKLVADQLIEEAINQTGLDRFDSESFREGLEVFLSDFNADPRPDALVQRNAADIVTALSTRLKVTDYLNKRPELLERPIKSPVFVFGIPRTGTTLLSNLLAADPARRSALTWEIDDPVPPPTSDMLYTDPRALAKIEEQKKMLEAYPEMGKYYRSSPIYPNECMFFMIHDFKALLWESRGVLPNYRDFVYSTDVTSSYAYHKRYLQLLQADAPGTWNLKMPSHALWLETLLKFYPDARLVWTHRDPYRAMGSFCSILALGQQGFKGEVAYDYLGENCTYQAAEHANRIMDVRDKLGEDRIIDVHYADLMRRPIESMRKLYAALGDDFTSEAEGGMQSWLDENPQTKFGVHEYKLAEYGLTVDKLKPVFERYLSRYDVELEGK